MVNPCQLGCSGCILYGHILFVEPPYLCLPTCVSIFIFLFVLFQSWPIAWLIVQCSVLLVVVWDCILEFDYLYKSFVDTKSIFCKIAGLDKLLKSHTIGEWWLNFKSSVCSLCILLGNRHMVIRVFLVKVLSTFPAYLRRLCDNSRASGRW